MTTITINNLVLSGIHGLTDKERTLPQRFHLDMTATVQSTSLKESIHHTVDYRTLKNIAVEIIKNQSFLLLETMAQKIAEESLKIDRVSSITVSIKKLDIWSDGMPGVVVAREKMPDYIHLLDFQIEEVIDHLASQGGFSFPILPEDRRSKLLTEAVSYHYQPQPESISGGKVREQLSSISTFPPESLFHGLRNDFMELLIRKLAAHPIKDLFSNPLQFNEMSIQKYPAGSLGITPHKDGKSRMNLIGVFVLEGTSEFALCERFVFGLRQRSTPSD